MPKHSGFTAELLKKVFKKLTISAHADEGTGDTTPTPPADNGGDVTPTPAPSVSFEVLIAQARKEEKDKLYPRIDKAEKEVKRLTGLLNETLLENATLKQSLEDANKATPGDSEEVTGLKEKIASLETELQNLKDNSPDEEALRQSIEAEYEIKLYAKEQIDLNKGDILSMFIPDITGKTKEEIDSAINTAKEKTLSVKKDLGLVDDKGKTKKTTPAPTPKTPKAPTAAPAVDGEGETFDAEYIRNLDPRSPEYKEFRQKLGLK